MSKLTNLATEYKKTKNKKILETIFKELKKPLKDRADYIFYRQRFVRKLPIKDKNGKDIIYFWLCDTKKMTIQDVEQDLALEVLELIEKYNPELPFDNYLFGTLKKWRPERIRNKEFMQELNTVNESELPERESNSGNIIEDETTEESDENKNNIDHIIKELQEKSEIDDLFENLTVKEKKLAKLKIKHPKAIQSEIAEMLGVTQKTVSIYLNNMRKKCKHKV